MDGCLKLGPVTQQQLSGHPDVMRFTGEPPVPSLGAAREAIANYRDFDDVGYGRWACNLKETQAVIGFCGLKYLTDLDEVDVGYRFLPEFWGRGLATEACAASLEFGFTHLRLNQIIGLVLPGNTASTRVLEKVGMQADGEFVYDGICVLRFFTRREARVDNGVKSSKLPR
jgi:ribosomal-protein-alanine N-acetyltransferase